MPVVVPSAGETQTSVRKIGGVSPIGAGWFEGGQGRGRTADLWFQLEVLASKRTYDAAGDINASFGLLNCSGGFRFWDVVGFVFRSCL